MFFVGTTVVVMQLIFYPIGIMLIVLSKLKYKPEIKKRKTWTYPLQKYFVISIWSSFATAISLHIIQNYETNTIIVDEIYVILESIKSIIIGIGVCLSIVYLVFYYRRKWGNS